MIWLCVSVLIAASQIPIRITALAFTISAPPVNKANLHEPFQTVTIYHDATNSHVLGTEFFVHALSITSYHG